MARIAQHLNVLKPLSEQKGLLIVTAVEVGVPIIQSDPAKLQQVLYNFLSNAIKFSPQGARIDLAATVEPDGEHVRISVTDRCNFRCAYCMPRELFGKNHRFLPRAEILSFEEIHRVARVFAEQE